MPIYEYVCDACQTQCELLVRGSDIPTCPNCGAGKLQRQLSVIATPAAGRSSAYAPPENCGRSACQSGCQFGS